MNVNTSVFFCHGCKERGTAVDFASYVLQISPLEAVRLLRQAYQSGVIDPDAREVESEVRKILEQKSTEVVQPNLPLDMIDRFAIDWIIAKRAWLEGRGFPPCNYFFKRGFAASTLNCAHFGWDDRSQRVVFPIFGEQRGLIGFKGRATDDRKPKYLVLGDGPNGGPYGFPRYYPSHVVYRAHMYRRSVDKPLVVCEGELNALATIQKTNFPAVAINGSYFTQWHAMVIRRIAGDEGVILFLDDDSAGANAVWGWQNSRGEWHPGAIELLSPHMPVRLVPEHIEDAADMQYDEIREILNSAETWLMSSLRS